jgi:tricarballylate dehydrogenase
MSFFDVVVVGGGNAGLSAALAARQNGTNVLVLERAPYEKHGGNTLFTGGGFRFAYDSVEVIKEIVSDLSESELGNLDFGSYTENNFLDDIARISQYRSNPDLAELLVRESQAAVRWHRDNGVRFLPKYRTQALEVDGVFKFWGGVSLGVAEGGAGLVNALEKACGEAGIDVQYRSRALELVTDKRGVVGVRFEKDRSTEQIDCGAVVLAAGGFQANAEWRTRYMGPGWDLAKVRGSQFNTGDGIRMALDIGATPYGQWSGCHAAGIDLNAPEFGDHSVGGNYFEKHSYPFGIMVNADGERFLDEGADFRNYTYAKYGREILKQPGQMAWQIFDQKVAGLLRDEYAVPRITKVTSNTLEDLASNLEGVNAKGFIRTVEAYNNAVMKDRPFNPNVRDGRGTRGLTLDKTNWAQTIDSPPYLAFAVTCGITFTFGGLRIDQEAKVIDDTGDAIPGLYAAGDLVGGIHYFNYPGGSGLTGGTVFGRRAGAGAASHARTG